MTEDRELVLSVTADDCEWSYTRGSGKGGQKRNKTSSAVHCTHRASGAHGYSESSRSQHDNRQLAFVRMVTTDMFENWRKREVSRGLGVMAEIEQRVEYELSHSIVVEGIVDGRWKLIQEEG